MARKFDEPRTNDRLFFLSGSNIGATGRVVAVRPDWLPQGEFAVSFPWSGAGVTHRVSPTSCLFVKPKLVQTPSWLAPFSIEDLFELDEVALRVQLHFGKSRDALSWPDEAVFSFADYFWRKRLPIQVDELENLLKMHRLFARGASGFVKRVFFARDMLVWSQGRRPINRKRIGSFGAERYMTPRDFVA